MRKLLIIPEMHPLKPKERKVFEKMVLKKLLKYEKKNWGSIRKVVKKKVSKLNPAYVKLYRDSWANPRDWKKSEPLVIKELISWGATPVKTEHEYLRDLHGNSSDWLAVAQRNIEGTIEVIDELVDLRSVRNDLKRARKALDRALGKDQDKIHQSFARARNRYIAAQINETLKDGETGLLFIGKAHTRVKLRSLLDRDIKCEIV